MLKRSRGYLAIAAALLVLGTACTSKTNTNPSNSASAGPAKQGGTFSIANCEPNHLAPPLDYETCGTQVFEGMWTPLVTIDSSDKIHMAQAQSITVSPDRKTYTIKINPGWTFQNGEPVTAQSYVDTWNWTALGSHAAILNFFFEHIAGYPALNPTKGKATTTKLSGLKVVDPTTFVVTLAAPFSQFEYQLAFQAFFPMPKPFFTDEKAFENHPIGDGPYMMDGVWKHNVEIDLKRYPNYAGTPGFADVIKLPEYLGSNAETTSYADMQAGNLDVSSTITSESLKRAESDFAGRIGSEPGGSFIYIDYPLYDKAFQSKELRQALSLAVDRSAIIGALEPAVKPADTFESPAAAGFQAGACVYCKFDSTLAKQKLQQAGGFKGPIDLNFAADPLLQQIMEAIGNQLKKNLGIDFKLHPWQNANTLFDATIKHQLDGPVWDGWTMDYPSIEDFLRPIMASTGGYNVTTYANPQFDNLLKAGDQAATTAAGDAKYQAAQAIVAQDMPIMPWGYFKYTYIWNPTVTNVLRVGPFDEIALEQVHVVHP